jgi:predicted nucleic acid-binding protein
VFLACSHKPCTLTKRTLLPSTQIDVMNAASEWRSWSTARLPEAADAGAVGRAHMEYRRRGGLRERMLPDFFVAAHAKVRGYRLLTREARRYRNYFPTLDLVCPEAHP